MLRFNIKGYFSIAALLIGSLPSLLNGCPNYEANARLGNKELANAERCFEFTRIDGAN